MTLSDIKQWFLNNNQSRDSLLPGGALPYKVYTALLTQSGTDDPVAIVLENTLGGVVVWTRQAAGYYWGVLNGTFPRNKTICIGNSYSGTVNIVNDEINEPSDRILLKSKDYTGAETDGLFYLSTIEIRVYP